jgi:uncharacterized protein YjbI with pentapeptide repeats/tetratricopeptide (TPR) repeat protein
MEASPPAEKNLRKSKFDGQDLRSKDLRNADLTGSSFAGADLSGVDLTGATLNKANLRDAKLDGATLSKVVGREIQARGEWRKVTVEAADLSGLQARKLEFEDCTFRQVNFSRANLRRVVFRRCTVDECDFSEATAPDISFLDSKLSNSKFVGGDLSCPTIKNTTITKCAFNQSDLSGAVVSGASFVGCDLSKADFIAGEFEHLQLEQNVLTKANFRYARGLDEAQTAAIRVGGGKASRGWTRKAAKAVFGTWPGRIAFVAALALIVFLVVSRKMNPQYWPYERLMQTAGAKRDARDFPAALRYCTIMEKRFCNDKIRCTMIKGEIARVYLAWGKTDEAIKYFNDVLAYDTLDAPQQFDTQLEIVRSLALGKRFDEAVARIAKLFERPEAVTRLDAVLNQLAIMSDSPLYQTKLLALTDRFRQTLTDQTMLQQVDLTRAGLLQRIGRYDEALKILTDLVSSGTASDRVVRQALITSAEIYMRQQKTADAARMYRQLHERFPDQSQDLMFARITEGQIVSGQGQLAAAEKIFREVIAQAVDDLPRNAAKLALANLLIRQRHFDESRKLLENMMRDLPETDRQHNEALILLASSYREEQKPKEAVALLEPLLKRTLDGNTLSQIRRELITCYRMLNRLDDAIKLIKIDITSETDPNQKMFDLQNYADLLLAKRDLPAALAALDQAAAAAQDADSRTRLQQRTCEILKNAGRFDDAVARLKKMSEASGVEAQNKLWALIEQVDIARKRNQFPQANVILRQIAQLPLQAGQMPPNFLSITWSTDPEGDRITEAILAHVLTVEPASTFVGANSRLALAGKLVSVPAGPNPNQESPEATKHLQDAEKLCREVIAKNSDVNQIFQAYETIGRIHQRQGDYPGALAAFAEFERTVKHERAKALAMLGRAITMMSWNKRDEALAYSMDCCRIASERAQHLVNAGRRDEAREVYTYVRDKLPGCWGQDEAKRFLQQQ